MSEAAMGERDWLERLSAEEWIRAALAELSRAEAAYEANDARGGLAGARRAAGMALNGALRRRWVASWGRTYMEHLEAVSRFEEAPGEVRGAAKTLCEARMPGSDVIGLRSKSMDHKVLEAAKTVMAFAYAIVVKNDGEGGEG